MKAIRYLARPILAATLLGAGVCGGDNITDPAGTVASVQITATSTNPRVGEATILGATAVNAGGVAVQGVACTMVSGSPAVLAVSPDAAGWRGVGISAGTAVVTATCAARTSTISITVRPDQVTLTINKLGNGNGSVFATPASGPYDRGTVVVITATALSGSSFAGWGGCSGTGPSCTLTLNANQTVTATFTLGENFVGAAIPNTVMGSANDLVGCGYTMTLSSGSLSATVLGGGGSALSGTAAGMSDVSVVVTFTPANTGCSGSSSSQAMGGTVSGSDANVTITASSSSGLRTFNFVGTRSGSTITGTLTIRTTLTTTSTRGNADFPFTKQISPYTMTKQ